MEETCNWQRFDRIAKALESLGYLVAVFGPLVGIVLLVIGDWAIRGVGVMVIVASVLVAVYHISFSLLMNAIKDLSKHLDAHEHGHVIDAPKT